MATCDGSGYMIGCPGCQLCQPSPAPDRPPPRMPAVYQAVWDRVDAEQAERERVYAERTPPW